MKEEWKDIKGYDGFYQVSTKGRIKSLDRKISTNYRPYVKKGRILKTWESACTTNGGYPTVTLSVNNKIKKMMVHRAVAEAFISNPNSKLEVNHKDGNKSNNNVNNLEWVTPSENHQHALNTGLRYQKTVYAIDLITETVTKYNSISDCVQIYGSPAAQVCDKYKTTKNTIITSSPEKSLSELRRGVKFGRGNPIVSIDDNGNQIIYPSATIAAKRLNIPRSRILNCVNDNRQHKTNGCIWIKI